MKNIKLLTIALALGSLIIPTAVKNNTVEEWSDFKLISEMKQDKSVSNTASSYIESNELFGFDFATETIQSGAEPYKKVFGENNMYNASIKVSGKFEFRDGRIQGKGNSNQGGNIMMEVTTNCPDVRRIALHCNSNEVRIPAEATMNGKKISFETEARGGKFYSELLDEHNGNITFTVKASWEKKEGIGFTGFSFCDAVEYSFTESNTTYSLKYKYEQDAETNEYYFSDIQLRFGGLAQAHEWDAAKNHIRSYGVMAALKDNLNGKSIKIVETGVSEVSAQGNDPYKIMQNDQEYVLFNGYIDVPMKYINTEITALAFFDDENGDRFFFDELTMSCKDIANIYINNGNTNIDIESLEAFANA